MKKEKRKSTSTGNQATQLRTAPSKLQDLGVLLSPKSKELLG